MSAVTAIVVGRTESSFPPSVRQQVRATELARSLGDIQRAALGATTPLVWLLGAGGRPLDDTLPALIEHADFPAVSLPLNSRGIAVEALIGRVAEDVDGILHAARRQCAPLRHAHVCSLVLARRLVLDLPAPDPARFGRYAGPEWTARLFAHHGGELVPASRIVVEEWMPGSPMHVLRVARTSRWGTGETIRELARAVRPGSGEA